MARFQPPGNCPACHEHVPARKTSCPHCGASADDGWSDEAHTDGLDLPDDSFNYDEYLKREFDPDVPRIGLDRKTLWWATAILLLAALTSMYWWH